MSSSTCAQIHVESVKCFLIQEQAFASKQVFTRDQGSGNRLPGSVIDYQKTILKNSF